MPSRVFGVCVAVAALCVLPAAVMVCAKQNPTGATKADQVPDLSMFPKLRGKVEQVLGHVGSFVPPKIGESFQLELKNATTLTGLLTFDAVNKSNIPLPGPISVESMHYYLNGAFKSMRLVSKQGRSSVTVDVVPKPGLGPQRALVWVIVQSEVVQGVALIDCEIEGEFPGQVK